MSDHHLDERFAALYGVFAAEPGGGSVAGVVLSQQPLADAAMQVVARDLAAPTTGFVLTGGGPTDRLPIRFFTPRQEIDACGYVTVAAATALHAVGYWSAPGCGTLNATGGGYALALEKVHSGVEVRLNVPIRERVELDVGGREAASAVVGLAVDDSLPCEVITTGLRHLIVPVADEAELAALIPSRHHIEELGARLGVDTVGLVSALDGRGGVRLRDLCAPIGDLEEPASGTTSAAVADFFARHRDVLELVVRQGEDMGRPSVLRTRVMAPSSVEVAGVARPIVTGRLHL
jgi:PhzF family phenazine biosynthesis protein